MYDLHHHVRAPKPWVRWLLLTVILACVGVVGYGLGMSQNQIGTAALNEQDSQAIERELSGSTIESTSVDADQESLHAAFVLWTLRNAEGLAQKDPYEIIEFHKSGDYARFTASPIVYTDVIDPGMGFAKRKGSTWEILNFGTGGDPSEFYEANSIPEDLRYYPR